MKHIEKPTFYQIGYIIGNNKNYKAVSSKSKMK